MITDAHIDSMLAAAEPAVRFRMQLLVDRIRVAEGGGVRREMRRLRGNSSLDTVVAFMGIPVTEMTRDELIALLHYQWRGPA